MLVTSVLLVPEASEEIRVELVGVAVVKLELEPEESNRGTDEGIADTVIPEDPEDMVLESVMKVLLCVETNEDEGPVINAEEKTLNRRTSSVFNRMNVGSLT